MAEFVKLDGYSLKWCSEKLQADEELVKIAVKTFPSAVEFSRGEIYKELTSNCDFMMSVIKGAADGGSMLIYAPIEIQQDRSIVLEAVANGLKHRNIPTCFQSDLGIALKSLENYDSTLADLHESIQVTKSFALDALKVKCEINRELPENLQMDEQVAMQILRSAAKLPNSQRLVHLALDKVPSLIGLREVAFILATARHYSPLKLFEFLRGSPYIDDKDFVMAACQRDYAFIQYASERLRSDRDVVLAVLTMYLREGRSSRRVFPLFSTSAAFQLANLDIDVKAIKILHEQDKRRFFHALTIDAWTHRDVNEAWLERGWTVLKLSTVCHRSSLTTASFSGRQ